MGAREVAKRYGYKQETVRRYHELFGEKATEELLQANEVAPPVSLRTNTLKTTGDALASRLASKGVALESVEHGFVVREAPFSLASSPEYLLGHFYLQGIAEMSIAPLLPPTLHVWDMCAAPGGKSTHLASLMNNEGVLVATDVAKVQALKANTQRLGILNTIIFQMSALDMRHRFDRILLDAPCTGSGIVRKDPTRKYSRAQADIEFCSRLQRDLIRAAARNLAQGGILLYATCSLEPEENEGVVSWALERLPLRLERVEGTVAGVPFERGLTHAFSKEYGTQMKKCARTYPHVHNANGMFAARFAKR